MYLKFTSYFGIIWQNTIELFLHTFSIYSNTFFIVNGLFSILLDTLTLDLKMVTSARSSFSSSTTLLYIKYKYYDVYILKNSIGNCYLIHFPYIPIYFLLEKLLILIFLETSGMNLKKVLSKTIELVELYNCDVHHI